MPIQFRNLVFEGGGVKGIAYVGALRALERHGALEHVTRVGGTSAGAINALIVALGYTHEEQLELMQRADFREFLDDEFGFLRDVWRLVKQFGWNPGDVFSGWIGGIVAGRLGRADATFADLERATGIELYVVGANLATGFSEVFSAERHADMPLAKAVRISMSIPLLFTAVRHGPRDDVYVDGGVILNYPVKLFDRMKYIDMTAEAYAVRRTGYYDDENVRFLRTRPGRSLYAYNRQTLGLRLDTAEQIGLYRYNEPLRGRTVGDLLRYARALTDALRNVQENQHLHSDDWHRTVYINTLDVGTTDFDIADAKKQQLVEQGEAGVERYFEWFDDPAESPWNRIPVPPAPGPEMEGPVLEA